MSGGSFDHAYGRVEQFADELCTKLNEFDKVDDFGLQPNKYEPKIMRKLQEIEVLARYIASLMKEVEWLYSGDISDDSFMKRIDAIENRWGAIENRWELDYLENDNE